MDVHLPLGMGFVWLFPLGLQGVKDANRARALEALTVYRVAGEVV